MKSMTGYGYVEYRNEAVHLVMELKSYNNRFLDLAMSLPPYLNRLEPRMREFLATKISRGRVELYVRVTELEEELDVIVDRKAVMNYVRVLRDLADTAGIAPDIGLDHLLSLEGVLKTERNPDIDAYWKLVEPHLQGLIDDFETTRAREGETTEADIRDNLELISRKIEVIEGYSAELETQIKNGLKTRFLEMLGDGVDESRIMAETAVMLVKSAIAEEVVRMRSHIGHFREIMDRPQPVGKKLDFICQELGREINTIGSKSTIMEVNQSVIEVKDALEKIREQLRNVE
ncbi:MAG TPA: YicC/YloC family endoribonuclease [Spirochaetia bacterium]|nr:YicC/YloC family endoribonuclease [Spirochaetia bacterium]